MIKPEAKTSLSASADNTILIVEDEREIANLLIDLVQSMGFEALWISTGSELSEMIKDGKPQLVLLDRKLPDGDGLSFAKALVEKQIPLIILTGRGSEIDRVAGLEIGADDYIVKPFSIHEVAARIRAVLRRCRPMNEQIETDFSAQNVQIGYAFDGWVIDTARRIVYDPEGQLIDLTVAEFDLLKSIVAANGRVLSRDQILDSTRKQNADVFDRTIDVLMFRLRRKIEQNPQNPKYLKTERGVGYRFGTTAKRFKNSD